VSQITVIVIILDPSLNFVPLLSKELNALPMAPCVHCTASVGSAVMAFNVSIFERQRPVGYRLSDAIVNVLVLIGLRHSVAENVYRHNTVSPGYYLSATGRIKTLDR